MNRPDALRRRISTVTAGTALLVSLLACGASDALAQDPRPDTVPQFDLDTLVVSVLGAPVSLGRAAYPVSVVGERDLRQGKTGMFLEEALRSLPGVQVQNRFNYAVGERISIRGFGSRSPFGVRGVQVIVDGIPATLPDGQSTVDHIDIGTLGRVEALRGPASALYGNSSGGVLRFETEIPSQARVSEELTMVGGSDGLLRLQSTTTGTVGETGYLVSLNRLSYEGFRKDGSGNPYGGADRFHLNTRLEQPIGGGALGITLNHLDLDAENPGSLRLDLLEEDPTQVFAPAYLNNRTGKEVQQSQLGVRWLGPVGDLEGEAVVYGVVRDFLNPLPGDVVDVDRRAGGVRLSLGGSTTSGDVGVDLRGGVALDLQNDDRREYGNDGGQPEDLRQNQTETVRSVGVFLQGSVGLSERVDAVGGLRYDRHRFEVDDLFPVSAGNADDSGARTMDAFSPTVGVHVAATPEIGLFANFSTSFQTPTTVELGNRESGAGGFNPDLDPQTGRSFEVGARGTVQGRFAYELALFRTSLQNELIPFENADELTYFRNAGSSIRKGAEAVVSARFSDVLSGQASYSYTDAEFEDYVLNPGQVDEADFSGNKVPGLSPTQLRASLRASASDWYVEAGAEYSDEVPVNDANDQAFADAYTLLGIRVGASALPLGGIQISPFAGIQNLTDETYVSSVAVNAFGRRFYEPGPGRTFYVGGTVSVSR